MFVSTWGEEKKRGVTVLIHGKQQQIWNAVLQHSTLFTVTHIMYRQVDGIDFKPLQENFIIVHNTILFVALGFYSGDLEVAGICGFRGYFRFKVVVNNTWMLASPNLCSLLLWVIFNSPFFFPLCSGVICAVWCVWLPGRVAATWAVLPQKFNNLCCCRNWQMEVPTAWDRVGDRLLLPWDKKPPSPCSWRRRAQAGSSFWAGEMLQSQCCFSGKCRGFASHLPLSPLPVVLILWGNEEQNAPVRKWGVLSLQHVSFPLPRCKVWPWGQGSASAGRAQQASQTNQQGKLLWWHKYLVWSIKADMRAKQPKHLLFNQRWILVHL